MKKLLLTAILTLIGIHTTIAQVGIGTETPAASAQLELQSTTKGFLPPRMTASQRDLIDTSAQGLMIYCTNCGANGEAQLYNGAAWVNLVGETAATVILAVGDNYEGGIIAYILVPGDPGYDANVQHGLIAAPSDQGSGTQWGCSGTSISTSTAIGTGSQNTINILSGCKTEGIAARLCGDLVLNGYNDWFLPSQDELTKLRNNRAAIGNFTETYYWSSTQDTGTNARRIRMSSGGLSNFGKTGSLGVRAVRAF